MIIIIMIDIYRSICPNIVRSYVPPTHTHIICDANLFCRSNKLYATRGQCPRYFVLAATHSSRLIKKSSQLFAHKTHFVVIFAGVLRWEPANCTIFHLWTPQLACRIISFAEFEGTSSYVMKIGLNCVCYPKQKVYLNRCTRVTQEMREKKNWFKRPKRLFFRHVFSFICLVLATVCVYLYRATQFQGRWMNEVVSFYWD